MLAGAFVVLLIFGFVVAYIAFRILNGSGTVGPPASPISNVRELPPQPRLQVNGHADLEQYLKQEQETLDSYGWVNRSTGIVKIPIDRAMKVLLHQGLPGRAPEPAGRLQARRTGTPPFMAESKARSGGQGSESASRR